VQLHGGGRYSNPLVRRLGAKTTVGLRTPDAVPLDRWIPYIYYQHEILRFLEAVALVGAVPRTISPRLEVTEQDRACARAVLDGRPDPLAVLHPGATDTRRCWPADRFAAVGDALAAAGAQVVITGSADERDLAAEVAALMRHDAAVLAGELPLGGLTGLLERAAVVVANDTGPRHLGEAVGTATVAVYWCGNVINVGPFTRRRHRAHISWRLDCPECGAPAMTDLYPARTSGTACKHRTSWVSEVPVAEVLPDALELLAAER
jgi:ADP-heptose:LPS heptosyltransferase